MTAALISWGFYVLGWLRIQLESFDPELVATLCPNLAIALEVL